MDGIREGEAMQPPRSSPAAEFRRGCETGREGSVREGQQADLIRKPWRMDYPAEIKRWRAVADQAEQMAKRWKLAP
jgi:hypothetical protein